MSAARTSRPRRTKGEATQRTVAGASLLLVLAVFSYLAWQAFFQQQVAPRISVEIRQIDASALPAHVSFVARNSGTQAAARVQIEGTVLQGKDVVERATAVLDYVPGGALRRGVLVFHSPFTRDQLRVRAVGFVDP